LLRHFDGDNTHTQASVNNPLADRLRKALQLLTQKRQTWETGVDFEKKLASVFMLMDRCTSADVFFQRAKV
jgi:hypothetical protein